MKALDKTIGTVIATFKDENDFLSNYFEQEVEYEDIVYKTSEHAYQAAKTTDVKICKRIAKCETPAKAKKMGRSITVRQDWDRVKRNIMLKILRAKFRDPVLAGRLLATGNADLVEGNTWGDVYWGRCGGKGSNWLGKLLMRVRRELRTALER